MAVELPTPSDASPGPFISYAREDQDFVRRVHDALRNQGRSAWVDWEILPSAEWMQAIRAAIDAAPVVVFVISPDSIVSPVCREELDYALAQNKRLIPVLCREVDADSVDPSLRKLNWIPMRDAAELDGKVEQLIAAMDVDLDWVRAHARLLVRAREWETKGLDKSLLLRGNDLKQAEQWLVKVGAEQSPQPTALQNRYVMASRRAQTKRQRHVLAGVGSALVVTVALAIYASVQSRIAVHQRDVALSRLLAAQALKNSSEPWGARDLALLLGVAAERMQPTLEARESLFSALIEANRIKKFVPAADTLVSLAVSPDGGTVATGEFHGGIVLHDAATLAVRARLQQGQGVVTSLAFSPDGALLASAGSGRIVLRDARNGQERRALKGGHADIRQIAWHPDGSTLYAGSRNEPQILVWDVASANRRPAIAHDRLMSLAVSPDGTLIASAVDRNNGVWLWDLANHKRRKVLSGHRGAVRAVAFSRDGTLLASAGQDSTIIVWDVTGGERRLTLEGQDDRIDCVAFSPDGRTLASGSSNRTIMLWDLADGKPLELLLGHDNGVMNVVFTPDGRSLISNAFDDTLIVWNVATPRQRALLTGHLADVRTVAASPSGKILASGGDDRTIRLWELPDGREHAVLNAHQGAIQALAFSPDGRMLASGSDDDHRIILWAVPGGRIRRELDGGGDITSIAISPDGKTLASGAEGRSSILLWDVAGDHDATQLPGHDGDVEALAFSPDGKVLVSGGEEGAVRVWDLATRQEAVDPMGAGGGAVKGLALSPDGTTIAVSAHFSGALLLMDRRGGHAPIELDTRGSADPSNVAFSPDGRTLAYSAGDMGLQIIIWDLADKQPQAILQGHSTTQSMVFTPDGSRLLTGHYNGQIALWDVDLQGWPERACDIANRNLTREEWKTYVGEDLPYRPVCPGLPVATN